MHYRMVAKLRRRRARMRRRRRKLQMERCCPGWIQGSLRESWARRRRRGRLHYEVSVVCRGGWGRLTWRLHHFHLHLESPWDHMTMGKDWSKSQSRHCMLSVHYYKKGEEAHIGVGLPNVFRKSPLTLFCGDKYSFSNNSGDMEILPAVLMRFRAAPCSVSPSR